MSDDISLTPQEVDALRAAAAGQLISRRTLGDYRQIWNEQRKVIVSNDTVRALHGRQLVDLQAADFNTVRIVITDAGQAALDALGGAS